MTTSDRTRNRWKSSLRQSLKSFCRCDATVATLYNEYIDCNQSNAAAGVQQSPGNKMHSKSYRALGDFKACGIQSYAEVTKLKPRKCSIASSCYGADSGPDYSQPSKLEDLGYKCQCHESSDDSVNIALEQLIQKLLAENRSLKNEVKYLRDSQFAAGERFLETNDDGGPRQINSFTQDVFAAEEKVEPSKERQICRYYLKGKCNFGSQCWNIHQRRVCSYYKQNRCKFGSQCWNVHESLNTVTNICSYVKKGNECLASQRQTSHHTGKQSRQRSKRRQVQSFNRQTVTKDVTEPVESEDIPKPPSRPDQNSGTDDNEEFEDIMKKEENETGTEQVSESLTGEDEDVQNSDDKQNIKEGNKSINQADIVDVMPSSGNKDAKESDADDESEAEEAFRKCVDTGDINGNAENIDLIKEVFIETFKETLQQKRKDGRLLKKTKKNVSRGDVIYPTC